MIRLLRFNFVLDAPANEPKVLYFETWWSNHCTAMTALTVCNQEGIITIDGTAARYEMMESWSQG